MYIYDKIIFVYCLRCNYVLFNPLTRGPRANQPYKFKMPNAQKILKWDKSHTLSIPLQVHLV